MVGPTAQLLALACSYNARARGHAPVRFFPDHPTCKFCEYIRFARQKRRWFQDGEAWEISAASPDEWLAQEVRTDRRARVSYDDRKWRLRLCDANDSGSSGGQWWEGQWEVGDRKAADQRIWRVEYRAVLAPANPVTVLDSEAIKAGLAVTLKALVEFCKGKDLEGFAGSFRAGLRCLWESDPGKLNYPAALAPGELFDAEARRLFAVSQDAWVFGGMGSWNDISFRGEEQQRYEDLSEELHRLLTQAMTLAVNSTAG